MIVTKKISVDLVQMGVPHTVYAMQNDKASRQIMLDLFENGVPWSPPAGVVAVASYQKPDGKGGIYDSLPDGTPAFEIIENVVIVTLAPQVCTVAGVVKFNVGFLKGNQEIYTFGIDLNVQPNPGTVADSEDFYKVSGFLPASGWLPNMYLATDENGNVIVKAGSGGSGSGENGVTFFPSVDENGNLSWSNNGGLENPETVNISGDPGERGLSMYLLNASLSGSAEYYSFSDFVIPEGYVPKLNDLVLYRSGHLGYIHEVNMESERALVALISGANLSGPSGEKGVQGEPGADGFSPTVQVQGITGGHRVTVTDKNGAKYFDVMDGKDGAAAEEGEDVEELFFVNAYEDDATSPPSYHADKTSSEILAAVASGKVPLCHYNTAGTAMALMPVAIVGTDVIFGNTVMMPDLQLNMYVCLVISESGVHSFSTEVATKDDISSAVEDALAEAKASGEFKGDKGDKGDQGIQGEPGKDGSNGSPGADGISPTVAVSKSGKVTTVSITDKNGTKTATINDGADGSNGQNGKDGTSVTVKSVAESTADGGSNVVTFSDGKTVTIKNGSSGTKGEDGFSPSLQVQAITGGHKVTVTNKYETRSFEVMDGADGASVFYYQDEADAATMTAPLSYIVSGDREVTVGDLIITKNGSIYKIVDVTNTTGTPDFTATFLSTIKGEKGDTGGTGAAGSRGTGILKTTTGVSSYTAAVGGVSPKYRISLSVLKTQSKVDEVLVGDTVLYAGFLYPVIFVDSTYAYMADRTDIRGAAGEDGVSATHSWNGTTLTVTSASGTSSANLKGDKGDKGDQGIQGEPGVKGEKGDTGPSYTLTAADKAEMVSAVIAALPVYAGEVV